MAISIRTLHPWDVTPREGMAIQDRLRGELVVSPLPADIRSVAAADVGYDKTTRTCYAVVVVMDLRTMAETERSCHVRQCLFPYVPGLLTFREGPPLFAAFSSLTATPDVVLFDGQGIAHPRRMGIAAHLGLLLDLPSIGCAKKRLFGQFEDPNGRAGSYSLLRDGEEVVGAVVRTRQGVKPVFVSPGHRADLAGAMDLVLRCVRRYRLPEPLRRAHSATVKLRQTEGRSGGL